MDERRKYAKCWTMTPDDDRVLMQFNPFHAVCEVALCPSNLMFM